MKRELDGLITQMHSAGIPYTEAVRQFKKRYILEVLAQHKGNQCKAAEELGGFGLATTVADARFAKPLDTDLVLRLAREHEVLITVEEGTVGGFGSFVLQALAEHGALDRGLKVRSMVLPDVFLDQDSPAIMYAKAALDTKGIVAKVFEALGKDVRAETVKLA